MDKLKKLSIISLAIFVLSISISCIVSAYDTYNYDTVNPELFFGLKAL